MKGYCVAGFLGGLPGFGALLAVLLFRACQPAHASPIDDRACGGASAGAYDLMGEHLYGDETGDPNTYCWHAAADTWRCVAGGVDVVDITPTGIKVPDDIPLCLGDDGDFCFEHDTDGSPDGLRLTQKDCDGSACDPLEFYKSGGANVVVLRASSVTNPDAKMTFGPAGASSHTMAASDSHFTGNVEVDGNAYLDSATQIVDLRVGAYVRITSAVGGIMYIENPVTGSPVRVQVSTAKKIAFASPGGGLGCFSQEVAYDDFTDGGGVVGTLVLDEGIPDGAVVQRAILHTLVPGFTGGANSTATIQIGDGTDPDRYNTGTPDVYTTNASGVDMGAPSGTAWHDAAKSVTITITVDNDWSTISAGEATVAICYWTP